MKNGVRVFVADTHVNPAAEVLECYVDAEFRPRLAESAEYRLPVGNGPHNYRVGAKFYRRVLGEAAPPETFSASSAGGRE